MTKRCCGFWQRFFFYIDGVYTIIEMATSYGKDVGISDTSLLMALLLTQVVAFPCAILFGKLTQRFASSKLISVCIGAYFVVAVYALWLDAAWKFWMMATFVGVFRGSHPGALPFLLCQDHPEGKVDGVFRHLRYFWKRSFLYGNDADGNHHAAV